MASPAVPRANVIAQIQREDRAGSPGALLVEFQAEKTLLVMVGIPGSGKTLVAQRLARCLRWLGIKSKLMSASAASKPIPLDEPASILAELRRAQARIVEDAVAWLKKGGKAAILDSTFLLAAERAAVLARCKDEGVQVLFIELQTSAPELRRRMMELNVNDAKWYAGAGLAQALAVAHLEQRAQAWMQQMEPQAESSGAAWVRLHDLGASLSAHGVQSYLHSHIVFYLMSFHAGLRPIYITRHGQSEASAAERIGTDESLSPDGDKYAHELASWVASDARPAPASVWTSTLKRSTETCKYIPLPKVQFKELDEIHAGVCDGMTYKDIEEKLPDVAAGRAKDKLRFRYPGGESYQDVIERLEPLIFELERQPEPVLIVGHQATLRCLYAYFMDKSREEVPFMSFPVNTVIELVPRSYSYQERRIKLM